MPKEARLVAAVLAVVAVIIGALVFFSGDDDPKLKASDTTATTQDGGASTSADTTASGDPAPDDASQVGVRDRAFWQTELDFDTVRSRFDDAESSDDLCVNLVALSSLPDFNLLPTLSESDVGEYFVRWQALAAATEPDVDDELKARFDRGRGAFDSVVEIVNRNGGTFNEDATDELLGDTGEELTQLLAFFVAVGDRCPPPAI